MDRLNEKYLGKDFETVKTALTNQGFTISENFIKGKKDLDILNEKLVIKLEEKPDKKIVITTTMFKKYI